MQVKVKKLHEDAVVPKYAKSGDAGLDLTAVSMEITPLYIEYDTGLVFEIPEGYVGLLFPRSSITNKNMTLKNSVGVLDSGYRNSVKFRFSAKDTRNNLYKVGERVGQIIILPYPQIELVEAEELSISERHTNGWGSTGV